MKEYKLSVVIPIFDTNVNYLTECFESINIQSYKNYEVILVNDCSKKYSTVQFINKYIKDHPKYKIINLLESSGPGNARNIGVQNSTGEIIVYIDSDDYLLQNCFFRINEEFNKWPDLDFMSFKNWYLISNSKLINNTKSKLVFEKPVNVDTNPSITSDKCSVWAKAFSKNFLLKNNIWFPQQDLYMEDLYYQIITISKAKQILFIPDVLYILRETVNSRALSAFTAKKANDILQCYIEGFDFIKNDNNFLSNHYLEYFKDSFYDMIESHSKNSNLKNSNEYKELLNKASLFLSRIENK